MIKVNYPLFYNIITIDNSFLEDIKEIFMMNSALYNSCGKLTIFGVSVVFIAI